jgi:hypothetical protein
VPYRVVKQVFLAGYRSKGAVPQVTHRIDEHSGVGERSWPLHLGHNGGSATLAVRRKDLGATASTSEGGPFVTTPCFSTSISFEILVEKVHRLPEPRGSLVLGRSHRVMLRGGGGATPEDARLPSLFHVGRGPCPVRFPEHAGYGGRRTGGRWGCSEDPHRSPVVRSTPPPVTEGFGRPVGEVGAGVNWVPSPATQREPRPWEQEGWEPPQTEP